MLFFDIIIYVHLFSYFKYSCNIYESVKVKKLKSNNLKLKVILKFFIKKINLLNADLIYFIFKC